MVIGVAFGEQGFQQFIEHQPARLIIALPLFILHHAALVIEFFLRHRAEQIAHPVAFQPQRAFQCRAGHSLEIIGAVEIGGAVVIGRAHFREVLEIILRRIFRSVEHQVFEQVGKAGLALGFVFRSDIIPHRNADHRGLAIFVHDHGQPVVEHEPLIGDLHLRNQRGQISGCLRGGAAGGVVIGKRRGERCGERKGKRRKAGGSKTDGHYWGLRWCGSFESGRQRMLVAELVTMRRVLAFASTSSRQNHTGFSF